MPKSIQHYEYLAQDRIRSLYQQIRRNKLLGVPIQMSFTLPIIGVSIGKPAEKDQPLSEQLQAAMAYMRKYQADDIGAVDVAKKYIVGTLPMFSHFVPQGFGVKETDRPEFICYGGATETTIIGIAGPVANLVGQAPAATGDMGMISSAQPNLARVLARQHRMQTRFGKTRGERKQSDESQALDCVWYMEEYNRQDTQLRNYAFMATVKLDSEKMAGRLTMDKRIILASPIYMALAE